jgi:hypothetical protein
MPGHWGSLCVARGIQLNFRRNVPICLMLPGWELPAVIFCWGGTLRLSATVLFLSTFHSSLGAFYIILRVCIQWREGKTRSVFSLSRLKFKLTAFCWLRILPFWSHLTWLNESMFMDWKGLVPWLKRRKKATKGLSKVSESLWRVNVIVNHNC